MLLTQPTVGSAKFATMLDTASGDKRRRDVAEDQDLARRGLERELLRRFLAAPFARADQPHASSYSRAMSSVRVGRAVGGDDDLEAATPGSPGVSVFSILARSRCSSL